MRASSGAARASDRLVHANHRPARLLEIADQQAELVEAQLHLAGVLAVGSTEQDRRHLREVPLVLEPQRLEVLALALSTATWLSLSWGRRFTVNRHPSGPVLPAVGIHRQHVPHQLGTDLHHVGALPGGDPRQLGQREQHRVLGHHRELPQVPWPAVGRQQSHGPIGKHQVEHSPRSGSGTWPPAPMETRPDGSPTA